MTNNNPATTAGSPWKLEGDYFEECNCDVTCPCVLAKEDPDEGYCNTTLAWHIQKGNYDNTINLDGLNVVAVFHTPGNMLKGNWKAAFYLDEKATSEQSEALGKIFSGQAGGFFAAFANLIGEMLGVKSAPIEFGIDGRRRWLHIKDSMELEIEGVIGGDENQESRIVNPAFSAVPGSDLVIARSTKYRYHDHGIKWDNFGKNGLYCKFRYSS